MATIAFAFGRRPELSQLEARELVDILTEQRTLASRSAAERIGQQVSRRGSRGERLAVNLNVHELIAVLTVTEAEYGPKSTPAFERFRIELRSHLEHGSSDEWVTKRPHALEPA